MDYHSKKLLAARKDTKFTKLDVESLRRVCFGATHSSEERPVCLQVCYNWSYFILGKLTFKVFYFFGIRFFFITILYFIK